MKCKRCGGDFPHKRGTYCGECEPDARPAGETALSAAEAERDVVLAMQDYKQAEKSGAANAAAQRYSDLYSAIRRYGTTIKAEARAALLADAPAVWVARDSGATTRLFSMQPQWDDDARDWFAPDFDPLQDLVDNWLADALGLTPGTCVRYRLVPDPEEAP